MVYKLLTYHIKVLNYLILVVYGDFLLDCVCFCCSGCLLRHSPPLIFAQSITSLPFMAFPISMRSRDSEKGCLRGCSGLSINGNGVCRHKRCLQPHAVGRRRQVSVQAGILDVQASRPKAVAIVLWRFTNSQPPVDFSTGGFVLTWGSETCAVLPKFISLP